MSIKSGELQTPKLGAVGLEQKQGIALELVEAASNARQDPLVLCAVNYFVLIKFKALPALNHAICSSVIECAASSVSEEPSA